MDYNFSNVVYVKPVRKTSIVGRDSSTLETPTGESFIRGFNKASGLETPVKFYRDRVTNNLITGLTDLIDNPFQGEKDLSAFSPDWAKELEETWVKEEKIPIQTYLEIKWKLQKGVLTSVSGTKTMVQLNQQPHMMTKMEPTFIDSFEAYLSYETDVQAIQPNLSLQESLLYLAVMNSPLIANSEAEVNVNVHEFYISKVKEETKVAVQRTVPYKIATGNLFTLETENTADTRYMFSVVLGLTTDIEYTTASIDGKLNDYIFDNKVNVKGTIKSRVESFNKLYTLFTTDYPKFQIKYAVQSAINSGVFLKEGVDIIWVTRPHGDNRRNLGNNLTVISKQFFKASEVHDPGVEDGNIWGELLKDLKNRRVNLDF